VNCSISYFRQPKGGTLIADATEVSKSRRLGSYLVNVTDAEGDAVAMFQGMAFRRVEEE